MSLVSPKPGWWTNASLACSSCPRGWWTSGRFIRLLETRWWFQIFLFSPHTWGNDPSWLIFFKWVETTNQKSFEQKKQINHIVPDVWKIPPRNRERLSTKKTHGGFGTGLVSFSGGDFSIRFPGRIKHKQDFFHGQPARQQVYYNVLSGYPFMSFGENVIVGIQNIVAGTSEPGKQKFLSS